MAAADAYVDSNIASGLKGASYEDGGIIVVVQTWEIASTDDAASVYRIRRVPDVLIPLEVTIMTDAITGATDNDLGTYQCGVGGAAIDKDCLMDGQTLASATRTINGLQTVAIENVGKKKLYELAGDSASRGDVDLVLTANADPTASGTVTVIAKFIHP